LVRSVFAALVVLLLGGAAAGAYWYFVLSSAQAVQQQGGRRASGPPMVEAIRVETAPALTTVEAVGTLVSNEAVTLRPEVSGRISEINFIEGAPVKRSTVLVKLDSSIEEAELDQARARLALAESNLDRARELRRTSAGTQRSLDEAQSAQKISDAEVKLAAARLAKRSLGAPFDGRVGLRKVSVGEFINAGTELVRVEQIERLKVDFRIPEIFLRELKVGQAIEVTLDAFPAETFPGSIYAIDPAVDENGRAVVIRARIENPGPEPRLRPGLFARVRLTLAERAEALWVPEEALVPAGSGQSVFKLIAGADANSPVAKQTVVELGKRLGGKVEVVRGLSAEDVVVTAGVLKVRDGAPVRVAPAGSSNTPVAAAPNAKSS
jgi:membrane fusion protein (multidrug efflux system)